MSVREILAGRAVVELGLRNKLEAGLKAARARITAFSASLKSVGTGIGVGGAALTGLASVAIAPLVSAAKSFSNFGDSIQKMAIRTGVSTEALSELSFAAGQSGTDIATVEKGIGKMQRAITDANQGMTAAQDTISALGLNLQQLSSLSPEQQFEAVGKAIASIEDPTQRAGMAMQLFGRSGAQLLPLLTDDIGKLREEARELGLTLSQEDADSAAVLNDAFGRLSATASAAWLKIGAAIAPAFTAGVNIVAKVTSMVTNWIDKNRGLFVGIAAVAGIIGTLGAALTTIGMTVFAAGIAIGALAPLLSVAFSPLGAGIAALIAAAVAAYYFRDAVMDFLAPLAPLFAELQTTVTNFASIFGETFGGVIAALSSGDLASAGQIAMAGLTAAFWQGAADIQVVITTLLDMLGSWIPGLDSIRKYAGDTFTSIGNAILAGRWDLAASIAMTQVRLAVAMGWGAVTNIWAGAMTGLGTMWDFFVYGLASGWNATLTAITKGANLLITAFTVVVDRLDGMWSSLQAFERDFQAWSMGDAGAAAAARKIREQYAQRSGQRYEAIAARDQQSEQAAAARRNASRAALEASATGRVRSEQRVNQANQQRIAALRAQLAALAQQSATAYADAGAPTLDDKAARARQELLAMIEQAKAGKAATDVDPTGIEEAAAGGRAAVGKLASTGTFSAAAAQLVGVGSKPMEETARNTAALLGVAKKQLKKKPAAEPAFAT